jgi:hypothetical protein
MRLSRCQDRIDDQHRKQRQKFSHVTVIFV